MFCSCLNDPLETNPNKNVCPICLAHPGVLPTINKSAIEGVLKLGIALNGETLPHSRFDRKSYFYPDLPKGYQISQYELPLVEGGELLGISIRRIHLEEDTAKLLHDGEHSLVDFNRAGVPLIELVTEPVIESAEGALEFAKEVQLILRYLDISDADMEKGQMRVEANVSIRPNIERIETNEKRIVLKDEGSLGTKVELKNINSFRAVKNALAYEIDRQRELLEKGEKVIQETRGWNEAKGVTVSQRGKEEAHDYRYLPEPDLPPMEFMTSEVVNLEELRLALPELPQAKRERFKGEFSLPEKQIDVLVGDRYLAEYFEEAVSELATFDEERTGIKLLVNYLTSDLVGLINETGANIREIKATPANFAELVNLVRKGEVSSRIAKDVLREMTTTGLNPTDIIKEKELTQISDEAGIRELAEEVIAENEDAVASYKKGKANALQFLAGQVMAKAKGRANPQIAQAILKRILENEE